jgi:hypothetical protein
LPHPNIKSHRKVERKHPLGMAATQASSYANQSLALVGLQNTQGSAAAMAMHGKCPGVLAAVGIQHAAVT